MDREKLLEVCANDKEFVESLLETAQQELGFKLQQLPILHATFQELYETVHDIKGIAANLRCESLCQTAKELESVLINVRNTNMIERVSEEMSVVLDQIKSNQNQNQNQN